jgi:hypothetical protein
VGGGCLIRRICQTVGGYNKSDRIDRKEEGWQNDKIGDLKIICDGIGELRGW